MQVRRKVNCLNWAVVQVGGQGRLNMMSWQFAVRLNDRVDHFN